MSQQKRPRVDFYKLNSNNRTSINRFCCQLADKVFRIGVPIFVKTKDPAETRLLDELMWTFKDNSFLPHSVLGEEADTQAPIFIGHHLPDSPFYLLINLGDDLPGNIERYQRIAEIINTAPQTLQHGRVRYSAYKKAECSLHFHEITT